MKSVFILAAIIACGSQLLAQEQEQERGIHVIGSPPSGAPKFAGTEFAGIETAQAPGHPGPHVVVGSQRVMPPPGEGGDFFRFQMPFDEQTKRTLVVGSDKMDAATMNNLREDLNIMSRILDKAAEGSLDGDPHHRRMGIALMTLPGTRGDNLFLDDYGAIFVLNVPIPLSAAEKLDEKKDEKTDSDWEQTKRELYGNRGFGEFEPMKYDTKKVTALKSDLLEALKNAANIRHMKSDQTITLIVAGSDTGGGGFGKRIVKRVKNDDGEKREEVFEKKVTAPHATTMTIRVRKSDVDAFAKGKMDLEEFRKKATISEN